MSKKSKTISCKHCGQEIAASAKSCPHCGGKNKKPFYKKWWFWILIVLLIGVISSSGDDDANTDISVEQTTVSKSESTAAENATASESKTDESTSSEKALDVTNAATETTTIEEQVIFDAEGLIITATEYVDDSFWGEGIKLVLENTSEADVGIGCDALIVNDYMIYDLFSSKVAAGKKANETLYFSSSQLKAAGITNIGKVEVQFHLYDPDTYMTSYTGECVTIETSNIDVMDTTADIEGVEIMNVNDVKILAKAVDEDSFWGAAVVLYIENNSGKNVIIQCDDCSINGYMMTPFFSCTVNGSKKAVDTIDFLSSELEENGIEEIEEIELKVKVLNAETYSSIYETDPITISNN